MEMRQAAFDDGHGKLRPNLRNHFSVILSDLHSAARIGFYEFDANLFGIHISHSFQ
jgi:hypothetical protein